MIHTIRTVAVGDQESKIDSPIILYRGDREVEVEFTINGSKFTFTNGGNVIKSTNATHGQLVINTPTGENMFSEVTECHNGKVVFVITKEMIDELIEVGFYSFQIRLFDESQVSRVTIPPVLKGIDIRNPIAAEDETNVVDIGLVDYAVVVKDEFEDLSTFLPDGNYNKTEWESKDVISGAKLNKIEDALYNINSNMEATDLALLNRIENINKTIHGEIDKLGNELESEVEEVERELNDNVERFKIDMNEELEGFKIDINEELEGLNSRLTAVENDIPYCNVSEFGAKGDDITDDRQAIQNAINYCASNNKELVFDNNKTYLCYSLTVPPGIKINGNGATLKKPDLSKDPYNMTAGSMKWVRLMDISHDNTEDSKNTIIENLNFDGNCWTMWQVSDGYSQEQASLLIAHGNNSKPGRLNLYINNCSFVDNVSDGIHIVANVKVNIANCKSRDCFRGGLTITGGNSTITVDGFIFESPNTNDGIDVEIDSVGYGGTHSSQITMNNVIIDKDLDIAVSSGSTVILNNVIMNEGCFYLANSGELFITNSVLKSPSSFSWRFVTSAAGKTHFSNVKFIGTNDPANVDYGLVPIQFYNATEGNCIFFDGCSFYNGKYGVSGGLGTNTKIFFNNCYFDSSITSAAIGGPQDNINFAPKELHVDNCIFDNKGRYIQNQTTYQPRTIIYINNITVTNEESSGILVQHSTVFFNTMLANGCRIDLATGASPTLMGKRILYVDDDPNVLNFLGVKNCDIAILKSDTSQQWKYSHQKAGSPWNHIWTKITE